MHGLIFVTWEKYLADRFGSTLLNDYRRAIGEGVGEAPLVSRVYSDEALLAGVAAAHRLTRVEVDTLLREYGRYFIVNGLTSRLCAYLLNDVQSGRELLLAMSRAHEQMSHAEASVTPPLFQYAAMSGEPNGLYMTYDSPRKLCPLLFGSIEGAAERYGEQAHVREESCMRHGAPACIFAIRFMRPSSPARSAGSASADTLAAVTLPWQRERWETQRQLADAVYTILPNEGGITLSEAQARVQARFPEIEETARPFVLLEAIQTLVHAGWAATSANEPGDTLGSRRYWRAARGVS
ncbi:MAG TPA: heme NO-binding domain-containing protein [Ktedonobacterales bacterium]|nr:heme NO-binding domain-containing protein [Ktedonobacterales bacterium]